MTKPVTIPNTFATATTAIPLSQLDSDFSTVATALNDANTYSNYAADTGVANAYVVTLTGVSTTYSAGLRIQFKAGAANTGASTLNVNGGGTKNITYQDASALSAGTIAANAIVDVMYDGTQFLLMNDPAGAIGDVVGPASSVDNQITLFNGVTGKVIKAATTGTGVVTALGVNTGSSGAFVVNGGALGTPLSGTVTNLTGTASININGTVGATTPNTGAFTTLTASTSITEATYPVVSQSDIGTAPNEIPLNQYLGAMAFIDTTTVALEPGAGITLGTGAICQGTYENNDGVKSVVIVMDLTGLKGGGTAGDIIGSDSTSVNSAKQPAYVAQLPAGFTAMGGRMTCLELPAGGSTSVGIYSATEGTGVQDDAVTGLTETLLIATGTQALGTVGFFAGDPAASSYIYMVSGGTTTTAYTAGRFLVEIFGV